MTTHTRLRGSVLLFCLALLAAGAAPALAQEAPTEPTGISLQTPYVGIAAEPGDTVSLKVDLTGPAGDVVDLTVPNLPAGWESRIRGGGFIIDRVLLENGVSSALKLEIDVPPEATEGTYDATLSAAAPDSTDNLTIEIRVAESITGGVSLDTEFPALQGPPDVTFNFTLQLANDTGEESQFELQTDGPDGWQISARPSGQSRASTVTVGAGQTERVTVDVDPPDFTAAGTYPVTVRAVGGGKEAAADLSVEVTGTYDLALATPDQRLNVDLRAGSPQDLALVVVNNGTAPLNDVSLSATPPRGWDVTFDPTSIAFIEPGGTAEVTATVNAASDAITGDYRITTRASVAQTTDQVELRATVETSAVWGLVGIAIIVVTLAALGIVFRRFGRR